MLVTLRSLVCCWLLVGLGAAAAAQTIWIVDKHNRPGTHFTDLPPAVAAAASGDIIVVRFQWIYQGCCDPTLMYQAPSITRSLTILGEEITTSTSPGGPARPCVSGMWSVFGIPAGQRVLIANLKMWRYPALAGGLNCQYVAGELHLVNCDMTDSLYTTSSITYVQFSDCQYVHLRDCAISAFQGRVLATRSNLLVEHCSLSAPGVSVGWPGLELVASDARLVRTTVSGSGGYYISGLNCAARGYPASVAVRVDAASGLAAGPECELLGAQDVGVGPCSMYSTQYDAVENHGRFEFDPAITIRGGVLGGWTMARQWQTWSSLAPVGCSLTSGITAPPNTPVILASSLQPAAPLPTPLGPLWLDLPSMMVLRFGVADSGSRFAHSLPVGSFIPIGQVLAFQAAVFLPNGSVALASPSTTPILPPLQ